MTITSLPVPAQAPAAAPANIAELGLRESATFDRATIADIQRAAATGVYDIRGWGAKRKVPHFDDLLFLGASMSRYPLEGYREKCDTDVVLGDRYASNPLHLQTPVTIAGMSFGALSANAKEALGRGASEVGTSTTTGDGGMTPEERGQSKHLVYQYLPSRYGMNPDDLRKADAIEIVLGQGAKPGGGGMLLGQKITERVAGMRTLPVGIDQRSASRHPDWTGPDDLEIKIGELREITDWKTPIYVKIGASRPYYDTALAVKSGADVVVLDGMQGGTAATQQVFIENVGIPTLAAIPQAVQALQELGMHHKVQLIVSGGIRTGADVAKAMALGADAVAIGTAALIALGDNDPRYAAEYSALGSAAGFYDDFQDGRDPAGITTQDPELSSRLDPVAAGKRLANYLRVLTMEAQTIARACGKSHLHNLEPEDLVALTIEASAMARVPLAGTSWIPGVQGSF
ncbi:FMN-binding glutamate synthase family protein [Pseudarthrobacter sp902506025]|uniref:Glutamate synthase domain-containing protein 2 n=1 Tax=Pseudarthrobacter defluvii TaxID=410837 RepID=A0ABT9UJX7_9MICC|nr:FMN-binding glutamate synthase family protein [Pseudarthrobacter defluvii]MDQ0119930.1 glutamate synthase domain-containing protein 2 [Pseudarthrobacter defluvii]